MVFFFQSVHGPCQKRLMSIILLSILMSPNTLLFFAPLLSPRTIKIKMPFFFLMDETETRRSLIRAVFFTHSFTFLYSILIIIFYFYFGLGWNGMARGRAETGRGGARRAQRRQMPPRYFPYSFLCDNNNNSNSSRKRRKRITERSEQRFFFASFF